MLTFFLRPFIASSLDTGTTKTTRRLFPENSVAQSCWSSNSHQNSEYLLPQRRTQRDLPTASTYVLGLNLILGSLSDRLKLFFVPLVYTLIPVFDNFFPSTRPRISERL